MKLFRRILKILLILFCAGLLLIAAAITANVNLPKLKAARRIDGFTKAVIPLDELSIPRGARIYAQGEATHGNRELQELKLTLLQKLAVEKGVRVFALEADFGECAAIDAMLSDGNCNLDEAVSSLSFTLYHTEEMKSLLDWLRDYNRAHPDDPIRFAGYDMQNPRHTLELLRGLCERDGIDTALLDRFPADAEGHSWADFDDTLAENYLMSFRALTETLTDPAGQRLSRCIEQFCELCLCDIQDSDSVRDRLMAENVLWLAEREQSPLLLSGHNGHVCASNTYDSMGVLLRQTLGEDYFVIGTDYRTTLCNLPEQVSRKRSDHRFASADPLCSQLRRGEGPVYLDFSCVDPASPLYDVISGPMTMGHLGESYAFYMYPFPYTYRLTDVPLRMYDAMVLYRELSPTAPIVKGE